MRQHRVTGLTEAAAAKTGRHRRPVRDSIMMCALSQRPQVVGCSGAERQQQTVINFANVLSELMRRCVMDVLVLYKGS